MRIALSIPDKLFKSGETLSKRLGVSRSRPYATALAEFVAKHRGRKVTERLNTVYTFGAAPAKPLPPPRDVVVERGQVWWADLGDPTAPSRGTTGPS